MKILHVLFFTGVMTWLALLSTPAQSDNTVTVSTSSVGYGWTFLDESVALEYMTGDGDFLSIGLFDKVDNFTYGAGIGQGLREETDCTFVDNGCGSAIADIPFLFIEIGYKGVFLRHMDASYTYDTVYNDVHEPAVTVGGYVITPAVYTRYTHNNKGSLNRTMLGYRWKF